MEREQVEYGRRADKSAGELLVAGGRRRGRMLLPRLVIASVCAWAALVPAVPAAAQSESSTQVSAPGKSDAPICVVKNSDELKSSAGSAGILLATCRGHGVLLGEADHFDFTVDKDLGAMLVDVRRNGARRVLMVTPRDDGPPLVEDISGQIAMNAGRGPMSPIGDIAVDLAGFADGGTIGVTSRAEDTGGVARSSTVNLGQQVADVRAANADGPKQDGAEGQK